MASKKYVEGIGRRKTSTARVRIYKGDSTHMVNDKPFKDFFNISDLANDTLEPLKVSELVGKYYYTAKVSGGGTNGQMEAVRLGLARALYKMDEDLKPALRTAGLVTRDPRMVERKKYNQPKARKKSQFSKR